MRFKKSLKIASNIIFHSKIRSWLTIIGIVIGIAAVVSIVSIGQGAQKSLEANLNTLSADVITISPGASRSFGSGANFRTDFGGGPPGGGGSSSSTTKNLSTRDVTALKSVTNVKQVMGTISGSVDDVTFLSKSARVTVQGVDPAVLKEFVSTELASGRLLVQGDVDVVVVGSRIASTTYPGLEINRQLSFDGKSYRVVGIFKESGGGDDNRIIMPIESAITILEGKNKKSFDSISVKIKDIALTDETISQMTSVMMMSHGILQNSKQDFSITSPKAIQERISSTLGSATLFLTAIAIISLIVGAIGIMNTMFTSVLEKTKEIGILKALGAKNRDIMTIFLLNAGIIGLIGGIFGILLGIILSSYIGTLSGASSAAVGGGRFSLFSSTYVSYTLVIEVFLLSIAVGLISGAIPAYRASRLKPVDALRSE